MRARHIVCVAAALAIGFGAKQFFFPAAGAEAGLPASPNTTLNARPMHRDIDANSLPVQEMHDRTFVFDSD